MLRLPKGTRILWCGLGATCCRAYDMNTTGGGVSIRAHSGSPLAHLLLTFCPPSTHILFNSCSPFTHFFSIVFPPVADLAGACRLVESIIHTVLTPEGRLTAKVSRDDIMSPCLGICVRPVRKPLSRTTHPISWSQSSFNASAHALASIEALPGRSLLDTRLLIEASD